MTLTLSVDDHINTLKLVIAIEFGVQQSEWSILQIDLDIGPMTLVLKLDLDIGKMSHNTKNDVSM